MLVENNDDLPIMKQRQRTAFPPNYIHSIDSSHMMLTAIACRNEGARGQPAGCSVIASMYRHDVQPPTHEPTQSGRAIWCDHPPVVLTIRLWFVALSPAPAGIDFAGVHDSFWTHAGTVERMNELLRDKFVELHSQVGGWAHSLVMLRIAVVGSEAGLQREGGRTRCCAASVRSCTEGS